MIIFFLFADGIHTILLFYIEFLSFDVAIQYAIWFRHTFAHQFICIFHFGVCYQPILFKHSSKRTFFAQNAYFQMFELLQLHSRNIQFQMKFNPNENITNFTGWKLNGYRFEVVCNVNIIRLVDRSTCCLDSIVNFCRIAKTNCQILRLLPARNIWAENNMNSGKFWYTKFLSFAKPILG